MDYNSLKLSKFHAQNTLERLSVVIIAILLPFIVLFVGAAVVVGAILVFGTLIAGGSAAVGFLTWAHQDRS